MLRFSKDFDFKIKLCKPRHSYTKGKVEAMNKFVNLILPYQGEFETEDELIAILDKICEKIRKQSCEGTGVPPYLLLQKEKEYLRPSPNDTVIESYLSHDRQVIVRKDSMVTYNKCKYSVPADNIGKPVRLLVVKNELHIYYSTDLISKHLLSTKRLNYLPVHYKQLLSIRMDDDVAIEELATKNLQQFDALL